MKIIVIGSGVIGITTAYYLAQRNHHVTVIDRNAKAAMETSFANGGQLSFSHTEPWADPNILHKLPWWLLHRNSPISINSMPNLSTLMWLWQFIKQCTTHQYKANTLALLELSHSSKKVLDTLLQETPLSFNHKKKGILHLFSTEKYTHTALEHAKHKQPHGCTYQLLSKEECFRQEESLYHSNFPIHSGILYEQDNTGNPHLFTNALIPHIPNNTFLYNTDVLSINQIHKNIKSLTTNHGTLSADAYIIASGNSSQALARQLGISLPISPLKGYSLSFTATNDNTLPQIGITIPEKKIVCSRLGNTFRIAGKAEIAGHDTRLHRNTVKQLQQLCHTLFPLCTTIKSATPWTGLRPATPDGLPVISSTPYNNLFLNTGHGPLGWTLACGSAKLIADIVENKQTDIKQDTFSIKRFS